jgi:flagellar FliL protein
MAIAGLVLGLIPLATLVVILIFGGIGALIAPLSSVTSKVSERTSTSAPQGNGPVVPLEAVTINLADDHYLRLGMALQLAAGQSDRLDTSEAMNLAVENYTGRPLSELEDDQGRQAAKDKLIASVKTAYHGAVTDVYFTQFVTQ